ncbi:hypothetical protein ABEB36_004232 [Hypothenemus hampei]|uniref:Uncharacterized protein n=1 Tax=Hypothenemus hampei TaxID=57062 RepID=A0ABD1F442_HYPHA
MAMSHGYYHGINAFSVVVLSENCSKQDWYIDSGASVHFSSELAINLFPVSQLIKNGNTVKFESRRCQTFKGNDILVAEPELIDRVGVIEENKLSDISYNSDSDYVPDVEEDESTTLKKSKCEPKPKNVEECVTYLSAENDHTCFNMDKNPVNVK